MRVIPVPLRKCILELYESGKSTQEIAQFSGFCVAAVRRVRQQFGERGTLEPRTDLCGRKTLLTEGRKQRLRELLSERPDATLAELGVRLDRPFRTSTVDLWLHRLGWRFKKTLAAAERDRPDVAERRAHGHEPLAVEPLAALVFVDESGANTKMTRLRDRAKAGVEIRVIGRVVRKDAKFELRRLANLRLHTRTMIRDGTAAFIGSQSLRAIELDIRREVGVIFREARVVNSLTRVFEEDWKAGRRQGEQPEAPINELQVRDEQGACARGKAPKSVAKPVTQKLSSVSNTLEKTLERAVSENANIEIDSTVIEQAVEEAVRGAVKQAVRDVMEQAEGEKAPGKE